MAMFFNKIRLFWPDAQFHVLTGDDFYFSGDDQAQWQGIRASSSILSKIAFPSTNPPSMHAQPHLEAVLARHSVSASMHFTDPHKPYDARIAELLNLAAGIKPDLFVAFGIESVVDTVFSRKYPTIRIGLGDFTPVTPADADINIVPQEIADLKPVLCAQGIEAQSESYRTFLYPVFPLNLEKIKDRKSFGLSENGFYLATISRHFGTGIFDDVCAEIRAFLDRHKNSYWLLIGVQENLELPPALEHPRIIKASPQLEAVEYLNVIDVLVPVTPGTGITALTAMAAGTPVLSMAKRASPYTDGKNFLPTDVAIMLGEKLTSATAGDLGRSLERLYTDGTYLNSCQAAMRQRAEQHIAARKNSTKAQSACIGEVLKRYNQRPIVSRTS